MPEVNLTLAVRQGRPESARTKPCVKKLLHGMLDHLTSEDRRHIEPIVIKYAHVFHDENENDFKCTNVVEHQIQVGDIKPTRKPPYRTPYALRQGMKTRFKRCWIRE